MCDFPSSSPDITLKSPPSSRVVSNRTTFSFLLMLLPLLLGRTGGPTPLPVLFKPRFVLFDGAPTYRGRQVIEPLHPVLQICYVSVVSAALRLLQVFAHNRLN